MALMIGGEANFKYFCKICKKGFGCGRALGGHMRAHGIGDESGQIDDDDPASDWEDKRGGNNEPPSNKRMYALRTNPNRLKTCRVCEHCGKEFLSWKSFLEHGKCTSNDAESLVSSPCSGGEEEMASRRDCGNNWSKRKRSFRATIGNLNSNCPSSEEEELANSLMMLANGLVDPILAEQEESCASASKEEDHHQHHHNHYHRRNPINFIAPISCRIPLDNSNNIKAKGAAKGVFECKACKKVFTSHQALGGHRASHKKVKGCFAARLDVEDGVENDDVTTNDEFFPNTKSNSTLQQFETTPFASTSKKKSKVHECSICHRVFSSGQALGGHKRCHWITSNTADHTSTLAKIHQFHQDQLEHINQISKLDSPNSVPLDLKLDLNLPAPSSDQHRDWPGGSRRELVNPPSFEVSTEMYLEPWIGEKEKDEHINGNNHNDNLNENPISNNNKNENNKQIDDGNNKNNNNSNNGSLMQNMVMDDEADSKVQLAKLSELKDMNMNGGSSPWLQVGIGSAPDVGAEP